MSGVVDQHMIIWPGGLLQPVDAVEHLDAGCVSQQPDLMRGIAVLACQQGGQSLRIMHSCFQRGPVLVVVVADDQRTVAGLAGCFFNNCLLDPTGFDAKGRKCEQQEGKRQQELAVDMSHRASWDET